MSHFPRSRGLSSWSSLTNGAFVTLCAGLVLGEHPNWDRQWPAAAQPQDKARMAVCPQGWTAGARVEAGHLVQASVASLPGGKSGEAFP